MRFRRVLLFALGLFAVMATTAQGEGVARLASPAANVERTEGAVVGASIAHPESWTVERERYTFGGTYGFTLWRPGRSQDHGGVPGRARGPGRKAAALRLSRTRLVRALAYYENQGLDVGRETVGAGGHEGVAFGPIPGSTPATRVYVPVEGRVYRIDVFSEAPGEEGLDADDRRLLRTLRFEQPSGPIASLGLPRANAPEALYPADGEETRAAGSRLGRPRRPARSPVASSTRPRRRVKSGSWGDAGRPTPRSGCRPSTAPRPTATKADGIPTGWTRIGVPNFWGQYTHGDLGYGRCHEPYYANDKFAVDYPNGQGGPCLVALRLRARDLRRTQRDPRRLRYPRLHQSPATASTSA